MKIQGQDYKNWTIEFVYAPFFEMMCSLHVLFHPAHHKNREIWADNMTRRMNKKLYKTLSFFDVVSDTYLGAMEFLYIDEVYHDFNVIKSLDALNLMDGTDFQYLLLNKSVDRDTIKAYQKTDKHQEGISVECHDFLMAPSFYQKELVSALKEYYYLYFQEELLKLEPFLVRSLHAQKGLSDCMEFGEYLSILHPRIEVLEDRISLHKYKRFDFLNEDIKGIEIGISSFIDPHLLMGDINGVLSLCIRAKVEKIEDRVHDDLVDVLKALGDKSRMKIIKLLYNKPLCTQEISLMLDISEAGISKHLKLLFKANLIRKIRKGNFVLYYLEREMIDRIPMNIYQYLDE
jgi:DNA-binding transcriptional ArsR family regulator